MPSTPRENSCSRNRNSNAASVTTAIRLPRTTLRSSHDSFLMRLKRYTRSAPSTMTVQTAYSAAARPTPLSQFASEAIFASFLITLSHSHEANM